uniref:Uncharacterized protein n=1 Tax=Quercus lobata TaxID=97700 RepID=A0A7N2LKH9_QUELO
MVTSALLSAPICSQKIGSHIEHSSGNLVTCSSKTQNVVTHSSSEAEYRMCCDNETTIFTANNPIFHEHFKHIEWFKSTQPQSVSFCIWTSALRKQKTYETGKICIRCKVASERRRSRCNYKASELKLTK